jgi:hypothetical protein
MGFNVRKSLHPRWLRFYIMLCFCRLALRVHTQEPDKDLQWCKRRGLRPLLKLTGLTQCSDLQKEFLDTLFLSPVFTFQRYFLPLSFIALLPFLISFLPSPQHIYAFSHHFLHVRPPNHQPSILLCTFLFDLLTVRSLCFPHRITRCLSSLFLPFFPFSLSPFRSLHFLPLSSLHISCTQ